MLERNTRTLADAKRAARETEHIERDYEKLWRKEDESIPQFIPIRPKILDRELGENGDHVSQSTTDLSSRPLALKEPVPLLLLPAPYEDPQLEDVERRLGARQIGFQETMMNQIQSLTDQMSLLIRSQQPGSPPPVD